MIKRAVRLTFPLEGVVQHNTLLAREVIFDRFMAMGSDAGQSPSGKTAPADDCSYPRAGGDADPLAPGGATPSR